MFILYSLRRPILKKLFNQFHLIYKSEKLISKNFSLLRSFFKFFYVYKLEHLLNNKFELCLKGLFFSIISEIKKIFLNIYAIFYLKQIKVKNTLYYRTKEF